MPLKTQFISLFATALAMVIAGFGSSYVVQHAQKKEAQVVKKILPSITLSPSTNPSISPSTIKIFPTLTPKPILAKTGTINFHIGDGSIPGCTAPDGKDCFDQNLDAPIYDESMEFVVKNENGGEEIKIRKLSNWTVNNLVPGKYRAFVSYNWVKYRHKIESCDGCQNHEWFGHENTCGYIIDLKSGDNVTISCKFENAKSYIGEPLPTSGPPPKGPDTTAPITHVFYPGNGGSITYKIDGKVCAIMAAPIDDTIDGFRIYFQFDGGTWIDSAVTGYLCQEALPNGQHSLAYYGKDKFGNTESTKTISFSVNIPGN